MFSTTAHRKGTNGCLPVGTTLLVTHIQYILSACVCGNLADSIYQTEESWEESGRCGSLNRRGTLKANMTCGKNIMTSCVLRGMAIGRGEEGGNVLAGRKLQWNRVPPSCAYIAQ